MRVDGEGPDTVLVPAAAWLERELDGLRRPGRRIVFYDTQARGRSEAGPPERLTFDREVSDMEVVRRHVGAEQVTVIGWSYLGAVVALYASRHPQRVDGVVQLCPMAARPGRHPGMEPYLAAIRRRELELEDELNRLRAEAESNPSPATWRAYQLTRATTRMGDARAAARVVADPWQHPQEWAPNAERTLGTLFDSLDEFDWRPAMRVVDAPALVVHGELDGPTSVRQEWVDAFPNGRLLSLPETGHFPFVERKGELTAALVGFLP